MPFEEGDPKENKEELKWLFKRLGEIINETLADSKEVQEVLGQIKRFGLGVDLSMVMGLGLYYRPDSCPNLTAELEEPPEGELRFELTSWDESFLKLNGLLFRMEEEGNISQD